MVRVDQTVQDGQSDGSSSGARTQVVVPRQQAALNGERESRPGLAGSFVLSYLLAAALLGSLVLAAGAWNVAANTRLLSALIAAGILPLGEDDPGLGSGVPEVDLWIRSEDPVSWLLVLLAAVLFAGVIALKGVQFHRIVRFVGIGGTFGQHVRAYVYGHGIQRMLPFRVGDVAWASALERQGATLSSAARVVFLLKGFLLFEIATFALIGLFMSGVLAWAVALLPPLTILALAWLFTRPERGSGPRRRKRGAAVRAALTELAREPSLLTVLAGLSLLSFLLVELASYVVPQAFSSITVPLIQNELRLVVVDGALIVMAVVGGYIARLVPVTPGGIGQFEWAFALVLFTGGLPFPEAAVIALLVSAVRYATGAVLVGATLLLHGGQSDLRRVLALYQRPELVRSGEAAE